MNPSVLIPRPETEILVTQTIAVLKEQDQPPTLGLEIGVGSGVISIELLSQFPQLRMRASELMPEAKKVAEKNAERILGERESKRLEIVLTGDPREVVEPFQGVRADFLVSNPPYLVSTSEEVDDEVLLHEPHVALFPPGEDPLFFYRVLAERASDLLVPQGYLFLEVPHERSSEIQDLFKKEECEIRLDLTQRERVLIVRLKG